MAKVVTEKLTLKFKKRKMKDRVRERERERERRELGGMDVIVVGLEEKEAWREVTVIVLWT